MLEAIITPKGNEVSKIRFPENNNPASQFQGELKLTETSLETIAYAIKLMNRNLINKKELEEIGGVTNDMTKVLESDIPEGFKLDTENPEVKQKIEKTQQVENQAVKATKYLTVEDQLDIISQLELEKEKDEYRFHSNHHQIKYKLQKNQQPEGWVKKDFTEYLGGEHNIFTQIPYKAKNNIKNYIQNITNNYTPQGLTTLDETIKLANTLKNPTIRIHEREKPDYKFGKPKQCDYEERSKRYKIKDAEKLLQLHPDLEHDRIIFSGDSEVWATEKRKDDYVKRDITFGYLDINTAAPNQPETYRTITVKGRLKQEYQRP